MPVRRFLCAASAAALLVVACGGIPIPGWPPNPRFAGCRSDELRTISRSFRHAARLAESVRVETESEENRAAAERDAWDAYRWWFGEFAPGRFESVRSVVAATRSEFDHTISIRCGAQTDHCPHTRSPGMQRERSAYANYQIRVIQVCPDFFGMTGAEQESVLYHEVTQMASDTLDVALRQSELAVLARDEPELAVRNAASFAAFAESVVYGRRPGGLVAPSAPTQ